MLSKSFTSLVAILLLALIVIKVSSFHTYTHNEGAVDDIENCITCELAVQNQKNSFILALTTLVPIITSTDIFIEQPSFHTLVVHSSVHRANFFGRPPPSED